MKSIQKEQNLEERDNQPVAGAPIAPHQSDVQARIKKRGMNVDDRCKLAFLSAWIDNSEVPFGFNISQHKSFKDVFSEYFIFILFHSWRIY